jgi:hypothetical protein
MFFRYHRLKSHSFDVCFDVCFSDIFTEHGWLDVCPKIFDGNTTPKPVDDPFAQKCHVEGIPLGKGRFPLDMSKT